VERFLMLRDLSRRQQTEKKERERLAFADGTKFKVAANPIMEAPKVPAKSGHKFQP